jgi:hypothetical protein
VSFCCTDTSQKIKTENTLDQHVLKVEVKTEVEEDRDQLEHQVSVSSSSSGNVQRPSLVIIDMYWGMKLAQRQKRSIH